MKKIKYLFIIFFIITNIIAKTQVVTNNDSINYITTAFVATRINYNSINNKLYVLVPFNFRNDKSFEIWSVDLSTMDMTQMLSGFNQRVRAKYFSAAGDFTYNTKNNSLYVVSGYSAATYVNCSTDKLSLSNGWNWISFPRLQRYLDNPSPTIPNLERINYFPCYIRMHYLNYYGNYAFYNTYSYNWDVYKLDTIQSTKGYKLNLDVTDGYPPYIELQGKVLDPDTKMTIYPYQENWIGYFLDYPQSPYDSFDSVTMSKLIEIKTQYWTLRRPDNWHLGDKDWIKGKITPFEYGDLIILKTEEELTFSWVNSQIHAVPEEIPKPTYYTYEEQSDYLPLYIQFDDTSDVREVAVKVNGEVKGAAVREIGDTIVEVNVYLEGTPPGASLDIETWSGYKSSQGLNRDYLVYNSNNKKNEKRKIYTGEKASYYLLSLKQGESYELPDKIMDVICSPNPFTNETVIRFILNRQANIKIEIYNIKGQKIKTLINGEFPEGYYKTIWKGKNDKGCIVNKGMYFYKITTGFGDVIADKILFIK